MLSLSHEIHVCIDNGKIDKKSKNRQFNRQVSSRFKISQSHSHNQNGTFYIERYYRQLVPQINSFEQFCTKNYLIRYADTHLEKKSFPLLIKLTSLFLLSLIS